VLGRGSRSLVLTLLILLAGAGGARAASSEFPFPPALRSQVGFWKKIFAVYSEHQIVIHDSEHLGRVYSVLDFRERAAAGESPIVLEQLERAGAAAERERVRALLVGLDARQGNDGGLSEEERRIWNLFAKDKNPRKFSDAADPTRIRAQHGLKERFGEGVRVSRRYLPEMEEVFRRDGLPVELTRLPLIESCFDLDAYSKVGAAGIWQFMPSTARNYLRIGGVLDERRDPLRATRGAALHLKENYEALGTWPLAITAYNHGRAGVRRAVRETGTTDIARIVRRYRGPLFGFASRNFYAEFLAAVEVEAAHREYFGELPADTPFTGDEVLLEDALAGRVAARCADIPPEELAVLNPAVDRGVFNGRGNLPRGYRLRIPPGSAGQFERRLAEIGGEARVVATSSSGKSAGRTASRRLAGAGRDATSARQASYRTHRVGKGQTLSHIARRYRVSVARLKTANSLRGTSVKAGQILKIPTG
jgi:membrane-bound lytic murein transglycosylase D